MQPVGEAPTLQPAGPIDNARRVAVGFLGLESGVTAREGRDLGVGLLEVGGHALGRATRRVFGVYRRVAGILERGRELSEPVELAQVRRAEAGRVRAADGEVLDWLPAQAALVGGRAPEGGVVRVAHRRAGTKLLEQREAELGVRIVHVVARRDRKSRRVLGLAGLSQRIRRERGVVEPMLGAAGNARRAT